MCYPGLKVIIQNLSIENETMTRCTYRLQGLLLNVYILLCHQQCKLCVKGGLCEECYMWDTYAEKESDSITLNRRTDMKTTL